MTHAISFLSSVSNNCRFFFNTRFLGESGCKNTTFFQTTKIFFHKKELHLHISLYINNMYCGNFFQNHDNPFRNTCILTTRRTKKAFFGISTCEKPEYCCILLTFIDINQKQALIDTLTATYQLPINSDCSKVVLRLFLCCSKV